MLKLLGFTTAALCLLLACSMSRKRRLPSKLSFWSTTPSKHLFQKWCSQIPESQFNFTGIRTSITSFFWCPVFHSPAGNKRLLLRALSADFWLCGHWHTYIVPSLRHSGYWVESASRHGHSPTTLSSLRYRGSSDLPPDTTCATLAGAFPGSP